MHHMDELVKLVTQKTGLSEAQARQAVDTVIGYLKDKLPAPVASQIDGLLKGGSGGKDLGSLAKGVGNLLGKK
jgi:uncharacterized protein (DUF2267 family)